MAELLSYQKVAGWSRAKQITSSQKVQDPKPVQWNLPSYNTGSRPTTSCSRLIFFQLRKNTFDWYQCLESSTKHHFHGHIFMKWTRMHSSRMRTICCSDRGGCVCLGGSAQGGVLPRGSSSQEGCLPGGCLLGVSAWGCLLGGGESACTEADSPPPDRILDIHLSKHYLSATTLRTVINCSSKVPSVHSNRLQVKIHILQSLLYPTFCNCTYFVIFTDTSSWCFIIVM